MALGTELWGRGGQGGRLFLLPWGGGLWGQLGSCPGWKSPGGRADPQSWCPPWPVSFLCPALAWASVSGWKLGEGRVSAFRLLESLEPGLRCEAPRPPALTRPPRHHPGARRCLASPCKGPAGAGVPRPPPNPSPRRPHGAARLFGEESGPICFHSESLKIPFWRNEKREARFPRPARWVPARARRRAGGGPQPCPGLLAPAPRLAGSGSGSEGGGPQAGQRPGRAHLHEAHTRGPSAKTQLNAGGGGRPKLAFPRPSGARSGRGRTKGAGRGERRVCRGIDLQMRLCQRIKAGRTPDPGPRPRLPGPRPLGRPGSRWACEGGRPRSFGAPHSGLVLWLQLGPLRLCPRHHTSGLLLPELPPGQGLLGMPVSCQNSSWWMRGWRGHGWVGAGWGKCLGRC